MKIILAEYGIEVNELFEEQLYFADTIAYQATETEYAGEHTEVEVDASGSIEIVADWREKIAEEVKTAIIEWDIVEAAEFAKEIAQLIYEIEVEKDFWCIIEDDGAEFKNNFKLEVIK